MKSFIMATLRQCLKTALERNVIQAEKVKLGPISKITCNV